jgi:plastocyanin
VQQHPLVLTLRRVGPGRAEVGKPIRFQASSSHDPSRRIVLYRWDWAGLGSSATTTTVPFAMHTFTASGAALVRLLVVDDHGQQAQTELRVTVLPARRHRQPERSSPRRLRRTSSAGTAAHAAAGTSVTIRNFSFGPPAITIHVGGTVTWLNQGPANHTATAGGVFNTGVLRPGQSASHLFTRTGTFSYICSIHPFMKASVTVLAATSSQGSGPSGPAGASPAAGAGGAGASSGPGSPGSTSAGHPSSATPRATLPNTGTNTLAKAIAGLAMLTLGIALWLISAPRHRNGTHQAND